MARGDSAQTDICLSSAFYLERVETIRECLAVSLAGTQPSSPCARSSVTRATDTPLFLLPIRLALPRQAFQPGRVRRAPLRGRLQGAYRIRPSSSLIHMYSTASPSSLDAFNERNISMLYYSHTSPRRCFRTLPSPSLSLGSHAWMQSRLLCRRTGKLLFLCPDARPMRYMPFPRLSAHTAARRHPKRASRRPR